MKKLAVIAMSVMSVLGIAAPANAAPEHHSGPRKLGFYYHSYPLNAYAKGGWASQPGHRVVVYVGCSASTSGGTVTYTGGVSGFGTRSSKYCPSTRPFAHWVSYKILV
jgi:hypothetical protein